MLVATNEVVIYNSDKFNDIDLYNVFIKKSVMQIRGIHMNTICRDIFKAIHEEKWLSIEYKNKEEVLTQYWIGIKSVCLSDKSMIVEGLHLSWYVTQELKIYIDSIQTSAVIEGSYFRTSAGLREDIKLNPSKYRSIFHNVVNLKILNYLSECNRLDSNPYQTDYALIKRLDGDCLKSGRYSLSDVQFREIIKNFQKGVSGKGKSMNRKIQQLALNTLSIHMNQGLYVLAYRILRLDVKNKMLVPDEDITVSTEFIVNGKLQSIRKFLDAEDYELLEDFEENLEEIKDRIAKSNKQAAYVDDMPYILAIGRDIILDLNSEYAAIVNMFEKSEIGTDKGPTVPLKAFFGELIKAPDRRKDYPIALLGNRINLDQLLAIHNAVKYPLTYIQGPPGTGKTKTIVNTMITAFFNEKTVLFTSYNNHPIDGVCEELQQLEYQKKGKIPFPIIRLGNDEKVSEALSYMRELYEKTRNIKIFDGTLERNKDDKINRTKKLTALLKKHEERLNLLERKEAIEKLMDTNCHLTFQTELQGVQLAEIEQKLKEIGTVTNEEAIKLVQEDEEEFRKYLFYTSAKYIKRLGEPKNEDLLKIIYHTDREEKIKWFHQYLRKEGNMKKFLRIFPIVATTSISAHRLGEPMPHFDMTIMDEASQGNIAVSLVPVLRGKNLMLVGDPQQLSPVILLDPLDNARLRKMYHVSEEYDYLQNSIYKAFLACDSISGEILLSHHYRCNKKIIDFNNKKYYNNKLIVDSKSAQETPLIFRDVADDKSYYKNTAPREAEEVLQFAKMNQGKSIGVITPFTNQRDLITDLLYKTGLKNVTCGTVHSFQGDQKDIILFSLALTDRTTKKTYDWLKNNKELINVATSRAKEQLVILSSRKELGRLHTDGTDDIHELVQYVCTNGRSEVTPRVAASRALGIKPYSSATEMAFLENLNHVLDNILYTNRKCEVKKEVSISQVFSDTEEYNDLFYTGRFDFVVYEKDYNKNEFPILAIELDGKEHFEDSVVKERDRKKNAICRQHGFELIRVENSYARRYNYMKEILIRYFNSVKVY